MLGNSLPSFFWKSRVVYRICREHLRRDKHGYKDVTFDRANDLSAAAMRDDSNDHISPALR